MFPVLCVLVLDMLALNWGKSFRTQKTVVARFCYCKTKLCIATASGP